MSVTPDAASDATPDVAPDAALEPSPDAPLVDARLVGLLDPVAEVVRGALAYHDAPAELPDEQPVPSLRVRRRLDAPGLQLVIDRYRAAERLVGDELTVDRLPLDRALATPRRRVNPMPSTVLRLVGSSGTGGTAAADTPGAAAAPGAADPPGVAADGSAVAAAVPSGLVEQVLALPDHGPGPQDVAAVLGAARTHRFVVVDPSVTGEPALLAALVLQVVGAGTPCWCPPELIGRLGLLSPELRELLSFDPAEVDEDDLRLASRIARQKRAAWADHDLRLAWRPDGADAWVPSLQPVPWPAVSVVLVSRRPVVVPTALAMIAAQRDVQVEVVVALHGGGDAVAIDAERRRLGLDGRVLSVPGSVPFGAVLNHAVMHTSAPVVLKWDDDDLYGPRHVQDLLIARRQTGAALVGKAAEFVYLDGVGRSIWRTPGRAEADSMGLAGGTFLTDRALLDEVGGYPDVARAVDHHLKVRLRDRGRHPFRTHGFGFVLRRHAQGHTWDAADERFTGKALRTFDGLPEILELGDAARATVLPV